MIYDISEMLSDGSLSTQRYKPRNKAVCRGYLRYHGEDIASLKSLAIMHTSNPDCIGGTFELEWYRENREIQFYEDDISIYVEYGEGKPAEILFTWSMPAIAIVEEGVPMAIGNLSDLMPGPTTFLGGRIIANDVKGSNARQAIYSTV